MPHPVQHRSGFLTIRTPWRDSPDLAVAMVLTMLGWKMPSETTGRSRLG